MLGANGSDRRFIHPYRNPCPLLLHFGIAKRRVYLLIPLAADILVIVRIRQLSVFDTGLDSEIAIDKTGGSRPGESAQRRVVALPGRYASDGC